MRLIERTSVYNLKPEEEEYMQWVDWERFDAEGM